MDDVLLRRRDFVIGSLATAGGLLCGCLRAGGPSTASPRPPASLNREAFAAQVGTRFRFLPQRAKPIEMELVETRKLPLRSPELARVAPREPFALLFRAPDGAALRQGTYPVRHSRMGRFALFIVPVGRERGYYEAIFS
jgi:hypothetical protein